MTKETTIQFKLTRQEVAEALTKWIREKDGDNSLEVSAFNICPDMGHYLVVDVASQHPSSSEPHHV
jgi:hypothetical protein